ncbi:SPW repeat protein [Dyadobacter sp. CY261]|uniref:SPW repeat protein n=1 Tax=Dyadobacter sp. CY261 TaxID=2907203 RepID=UPI001F27B50A|nr:SPW repeat protein [Dyadobacter sp. CY261]MCF0074185.1 SPW repeat protein [Dyadobacter sp. CY261]
MKIINTRLHGKIDYVAGLLFIASPWIFDFRESDAATWVLMAIGLLSVALSMFTDYEGGIVRSIPMRVHLTTDIFAGAFLASSPWLFGFAQDVFLPHLLMGLFQVLAGLLTSAHPSHDQSRSLIDPKAEGIS